MAIAYPDARASAATEFSPGTVFEAETMRSTLLELNDDVFRSEVEAGPKADGGPLHRHMHQSERFIVAAGTLRVRTGLRGERLVGPGEEILIAAGTPHTFSVVGGGARFVAEFTPPLRVAEYFLELFALEDPGLGDLARLARRYPREHFYLPVVPPVLQRILLRPFSWRVRSDPGSV